MKIVFATNNRHKLQEAAAILGPGFELSTPTSLGITEDIPETADTLEGNALQKARYIVERMRDAECMAVFADDTGLEVMALAGADGRGVPGVRSARYAADAGLAAPGEHNFEENNRLLLENLKGAADRSARFRTVIALISGGEEHLFEGVVEGHITQGYSGEGGFGYDPVFVPEGACETFAQMNPQQKNAISHRARAVEKLARFLRSRLND